MTSLPELPIDELNQIIAKPFLDKLEKEIRQQQALLRKTEEIYETYHKKLKRLDSDKEIPKYINETDWLKTTLYQVLENEFPEKREIYFEEEFKTFYEECMLFIERLPREVEVEQKESRFQITSGDTLWVRSVKPFKKLLFWVSRLPQKLTNAFRTKKKPIKRWSHKVPVRSLVRHYLLNEFILQCLPIFKELQQQKCDALNLKWSIDRDINMEISLFLEKEENTAQDLLEHIDTIAERNSIQENVDDLDRKLELWDEKVKSILTSLRKEYLEAVDKVDTFELSRSDFSDNRIASGQKSYQENHLRLFNGWRNTLFAQLDDFQLDIEFYHIKYSGLLQFFLLQNSCRLRINKTITQNIERINEEFDLVVSNIKNSSKSSKEVEGLLKTERKRLIKTLDQTIIPQAIEAIYNQNLPYLLDRLELKVKEQVDKMKDKRIIYAYNEYNKPISKSELSHFNPKELVLVDSFKQFSELNKKLKSEVVKKIEKLQIDLKELGGIVDYNLDSAINSVKEKGDEEDISHIALDGVERSKVKVSTIEKDLQTIQDLVNEKLRAGIDELNNALIKLTDNENITALRLQLARAKAVRKTEEYRQNIIRNAKQFGPLAYRFVRSQFSNFSALISSALKSYGLFEKNQELTTELSDFLNQSEAAISKLPYVYRRLYRVEPLQEEIFFEGRKKELDQIESAYKKWQEGLFSNCCLIGEKGSGASSLVNFFIEKVPAKKVIRYKFQEAISSKDEFYKIFQTLLKNKEIDSLEQIVEHLKQNNKELIVFEDMQHLFLKKLGGFEALNLLFELMSQTAKDIFWISEVTLYTWDYLQRTIHIQRYFKNQIKLNPLTSEQIIQLIMKRHRVSGYNLAFEAVEPTRSEHRKLRKMSEEEEQKYLKTRYFTRLNNFAQSNISLALLYWIRSTQKVEDNTIYIGEVRIMQFNFLKNLHDQQIFTLHNLLIHDSLDVEEHAEIFHQSENQSRMNLMVLEDNGVVSSKNGRFYINRLLYRQTVNVLKNKNILH
ncbi:MAG: ATP-binding protein [Vicingaceae bacterium]